MSARIKDHIKMVYKIYCLLGYKFSHESLSDWSEPMTAINIQSLVLNNKKPKNTLSASSCIVYSDDFYVRYLDVYAIRKACAMIARYRISE